MSDLTNRIEDIVLGAVAARIGRTAQDSVIGLTRDPDSPNAAILHVDSGANALVCISALEAAGLVCLSLGRDHQDPYGARIHISSWDQPEDVEASPPSASGGVQVRAVDDVDERPVIAVDVVLFSKHNGQRHTLMIRRGAEPFKGWRALPGGRVAKGESVVQAAARRLSERTGLAVELADLTQVGIRDASGRDPRGWYVSVAFAATVRQVEAAAGSGVESVRWVPVDELLNNGRIAFDHEQIIREALSLRR